MATFRFLNGIPKPYGKLGTPSHALSRPAMSGPVRLKPQQDLLGELTSDDLPCLCLQFQSQGVGVLAGVGLCETLQ